MNAHLSAVLKSTALIGVLLAAFAMILNIILPGSAISAVIIVIMTILSLVIFAASVNKKNSSKAVNLPKEQDEAEKEPVEREESETEDEPVENREIEEDEEEKEKRRIEVILAAEKEEEADEEDDEE